MERVYAGREQKATAGLCAASGVEEDGETEAGKRSRSGQFAGADRSPAVPAARDHAHQLVRQAAQVGGLKAGNARGLRPKVDPSGVAVPARFLGASCGKDAVALKEAGHLL